MRVNPIPPGHKRKWLQCSHCLGIASYDYVPYSGSTPILTMPCRHSIDDADAISETAALDTLARLFVEAA